MKSRNPYPDECKQEAVKLVTEQGMRPGQVARDLASGLDTLRRWLQVARPVADQATDSLTPAAELVRLRREVEQVRMERDILKKALGIFSRMPQ